MAELDYELEGCRTCGVFSPLQYNYLRYLFEEDEDSNVDIRNILALLRSWNIKVEVNDGLPQYICTQCILQLSETFKVQKSCLQVQDELRNWYFREMPGVHIKKEVEEDVKDDDNDNDDNDDDYDISEHNLGPFEPFAVDIQPNSNLEKNNILAHDEGLLIAADGYYLQSDAAQNDNIHEIELQDDNNEAITYISNISEMSKIRLNENQEQTPVSEEVEIEYENEEEFYTTTTILCCICHEEFNNEAEHDTHYWQAHTDEVEMNMDRTENQAENTLQKNDVSFSMLNPSTTNVLNDDLNGENYGPNNAKNRFKCHMCTKSFSLQFSLNRHVERHKQS